MKFKLRTLLIAFVVLAGIIAANADRLSELFEPKETGDLMSEKKFWGIIDKSWEGATTDPEFRANLRRNLNQLTEENLQRFDSR